MYLLYLDDSGSVNNPNESHLVLGGISVFERQVHWLSTELDKIAASIYPANPKEIEFHASEIFAGRKPPWNAWDKEKRRQILKEVLTTVAKASAGVSLFACVVHKGSYPNRDPMEIAFEELCSRFDLQLKRIYSVRKDAQRGLIVLDESSYETSLQNLAHNFRQIGTRWGTIANLAEVPLFVDSRASRLVQLADHVAYSVFRRYEAKDTTFLDIIINKFDSENGRLHGLIHKQNRDANCMCPACMSRSIQS